MPSAFASLPLLASALLCLVPLFARFDRGDNARLTVWASRTATVLALLFAAAAGVLVASYGTLASPLLGLDGFGLMARLDPLSTLLFALVAFVGLIVVGFSRNYLRGEPRQARFLGRLSVALAAALLLVTSGTLVQLVAAWVGASLSLERLLMFYPERPQAVLAVRKKRIGARLSDVLLIAACVLIARELGTTDIALIAERVSTLSSAGAISSSLQISALLLAGAALVKSAQLPFHGWLPAAMDTPTPVSALLHAGMINAGGFLVVRFADLVVASHSALLLLAIVGAATAVVASTIMLSQTSVKASLAYSTVAQMGFMMLECGLGAFSLAILHLVAHSLYKAHAFLASGSIVEVARALPTPAGATRRPRALWLASSFLMAGAVFAASSLAFGLPLGAASLGLGALLVVGNAHLIARATEEGPSTFVVTRVVAAAAAVALAYLALKTGFNHLLGSVLPEPSLPSTAVILVLTAAVAALAGLGVWQLRLFTPDAARSPRLRALYVWVKHGFYLDRLLERLLGPVRTTSFALAQRPHPHVVDESPASQTIDAAVERTVKKIAPLWPLDRFVAVNPFLGLTDLPFAEAALTMSRVAGARMTPSREFFIDALATGRITEADVVAAKADVAGGAHASELLSCDELRVRDDEDVQPRVFPTVADVARGVTGSDWPRLVTEAISSWAAAHFDEGQALWPSPWRDQKPFAAWRAEARLDRTPELAGLSGFRALVAELPELPAEAIAWSIERLAIPASGLDAYLHRLLMTVGGWAAHTRYRDWEAELSGRAPGLVAELLAIRLVYEVALLQHLERRGSSEAWRDARAELLAEPNSSTRASLECDLLLQSAYEKGFQRELVRALAAAGTKHRERPEVQAAFCIDVRSEVFRRALERVDARAETLGVAGFFGVAVEWVPVGSQHGHAQCPVLIAPSATVCEAASPAGREPATAAIARARALRKRVALAWRSFKVAATSSFVFVETVGLAYAVRLVSDSLGLTRPVPAPHHHALPNGVQTVLRPRLQPEATGGRVTGLAAEKRVAIAEGLLRALSLTDDFARLVVLAGHGSTTVNNPYATALDCGACGGHTGEPNARIAAAVLNDAEVRSALESRGISIPDDTVFVAALHDTTTDAVTVLDRSDVPNSHARDLERLEVSLAEAGRLARADRAQRFGYAADESLDAAAVARSRDWSEVRPEWGLAGCAAFVAAPRHRTRGVDLDGRAFLHSYDWLLDERFEVLEQLMTAPVVVASWINLQYFGSSVDNRAFGSGNKVLHNVVAGTLGVLEGAGGDLRVGLPWQSLHDGKQLVHEPLRLTVLVEAPIEAMNRIIAKHEPLRALLDNGWLHLVALDEAGAARQRYAGDLTWRALVLDSAGVAAQSARRDVIMEAS